MNDSCKSACETNLDRSETPKCGSGHMWDLGVQGGNANAPARNNAPGGKHHSRDTREVEACPPTFWNTVKYRVEEMRPKWPFWKHRAPKMLLAEAQCAHRKHCYPETPLGSDPTSRPHNLDSWTRLNLFRGRFCQIVGLPEIRAHWFVTCRRACKRTCKVTCKLTVRWEKDRTQAPSGTQRLIKDTPLRPCVSKQCPADGVWRIGRGVSPDRVLKTRFTPSESSAGHGLRPQRAPKQSPANGVRRILWGLVSRHSLLDTVKKHMAYRLWCPSLTTSMWYSRIFRTMFVLAQSQSLAISALTKPNRQKSCRKKGFRAQKFAAWNRKALATFHHTLKSQCSIALILLSRKSQRFLGSAMGIAIANRKNRCDFGALRCSCWSSKLFGKDPICRVAAPMFSLTAKLL